MPSAENVEGIHSTDLQPAVTSVFSASITLGSLERSQPTATRLSSNPTLISAWRTLFWKLASWLYLLADDCSFSPDATWPLPTSSRPVASGWASTWGTTSSTRRTYICGSRSESHSGPTSIVCTPYLDGSSLSYSSSAITGSGGLDTRTWAITTRLAPLPIASYSVVANV